MKRAVILAAILLPGCAAQVEQATDRLEDVAAVAITEGRRVNDGQFRRWRLIRDLADVLSCNLSRGAIERNATEAERAEIEAVECDQ